MKHLQHEPMSRNNHDAHFLQQTFKLFVVMHYIQFSEIHFMGWYCAHCERQTSSEDLYDVYTEELHTSYKIFNSIRRVCYDFTMVKFVTTACKICSPMQNLQHGTPGFRIFNCL
jgi:hypothetical protein